MLVAPRDASALAAAVRVLADAPERRRELGAAAREKARRDFDDQRCVAITLETYRRLLASRSAAVARAS